MKIKNFNYKRNLLSVLLSLTFFIGSNLYSQTLPPGFTQTKLATLQLPMGIAAAPDGRIFICEKTGAVKVFKNGEVLSTPALSEEVDQWGERGMLSLAVDPEFQNNNFIYVYYTAKNPARNVLKRYRMEGDIAVEPFTLLELDNLVVERHMGGGIAFGKDGKIFLASGENGQHDKIHKVDNTFGKILRINPDGTAPTDNPFFSSTNIKTNYIWSVGVRNPYTLSVQPGTGKMYFNEIGQDLGTGYEEINDATLSAKNYGWPKVEGVSTDPKFTNPVFSYQIWGEPHPLKGCAITGGTFFSPGKTSFPSEYYGKYFFMDYCNNWINYLDPSSADIPSSVKTFASGTPWGTTSLIVGADGDLYFLTVGVSALYKISYSAAAAPTINSTNIASVVPAGQNTTLTVSTSGTAPFSYQWKKDGIDIQGATSSSYAINNLIYENSGSYSVVVTNIHGSTTSSPTKLTVGKPNDLPVPRIITPLVGSTYKFGDKISFSGSASDKEDGEIPSSSLSWRYEFIHGKHAHPINYFNGVNKGSFVTDFGETSTDVGYRIVLTATDSQGQTASTSIDISPKLSSFYLETIPSGLQVTVDETIKETPVTIEGVINQPRTLGAISFLKSGNKFYEFVGWVENTTPTLNINVESNPDTYTAYYRETTNIALNKPVKTSSTGKSPKSLASFAVDGNPSTRWSTVFSNPQWLYVDLQKSYTIKALNIFFDGAYRKDYKIQVSMDALSWYDIKEVKGNTEYVNTISDLETLARFVRIYGTLGTEAGYSIYELEVFGAPDNSGITDLALYKPVKASSEEKSNPPTIAANIVDGKASTRWSSLHADPQWVYVDLIKPYYINGVNVTWEGAYGKDYKIQVSTDAVKWTDIKTVKGNIDFKNNWTNLTGYGRYVRIYGTARGTEWGYSIFSLEVFGKPISPSVNTTTPNPASVKTPPALVTTEN